LNVHPPDRERHSIKARERGSALKNDRSMTNVALNPEGPVTFQPGERGKALYNLIV
jgi:hypothetical protein